MQQANQSRPLSTPVRDGQYWTAMVPQPGENMVTILPHSYCHNQRGLWRNGFKNIHAHALVPYKAMFHALIVWMGSFYRNSFGSEGGNNFSLHIRLSWPAGLIGW